METYALKIDIFLSVMCGRNIQKVTIEGGVRVTEKISNFVYVRSIISEL